MDVTPEKSVSAIAHYRRSVRVLQRRYDDEKSKECIHLASLAPTNNMQLWGVLPYSPNRNISKLSVACFQSECCKNG
jgi:hypothetical protein